MKRAIIKNILIKKEIDADADLSYLGEFSSNPCKLAIETNLGSNYYPYFNPTNATNKKEANQDFDRIMSYENGNWCMVSIIAEAEIHIQHNGYSRIHHITSAGLYGIESDSDNSYFIDIAKQELADLKENLITFNVNLKNFKQLSEEALNNLD